MCPFCYVFCGAATILGELVHRKGCPYRADRQTQAPLKEGKMELTDEQKLNIMQRIIGTGLPKLAVGDMYRQAVEALEAVDGSTVLSATPLGELTEVRALVVRLEARLNINRKGLQRVEAERDELKKCIEGQNKVLDRNWKTLTTMEECSVTESKALMVSAKWLKASEEENNKLKEVIKSQNEMHKMDWKAATAEHEVGSLAMKATVVLDKRLKEAEETVLRRNASATSLYKSLITERQRLEKANERIGSQREALKRLGEKYKALKGTCKKLNSEVLKKTDKIDELLEVLRRLELRAVTTETKARAFQRFDFGSACGKCVELRDELRSSSEEILSNVNNHLIDKKALDEAVGLLRRAELRIRSESHRPPSSTLKDIQKWLRWHHVVPLGVYGSEPKLNPDGFNV